MTADAIRQVGLPDRALLTAAVRRFEPAAADDRSIDSWVTAFVAERSHFAFVALRADEILGWAWGHRVRRPGADPVAVVDRLEVVPAARRQGTGTLLLEAVLADARRRGCVELVGIHDPADPVVAGFVAGMGDGHGSLRRVVWQL